MRFFYLIILLINSLHASRHHVGVFCATNEKIPQEYKELAFTFGQELAKSDLALITGGCNSGLMNAVMNGFTSEEGNEHLKGVIPSLFKKFDVHHPDIPKNNLIWTDTVHQRLQTFHKECDTLVILPGGIGTLHELLDFFVPKQWGLLDKKIILVNVDNYWDHLLQQFQLMIEKNALHQNHLDLLTVVTNVEQCMKEINNQQKVTEHKGLKERYWEKVSH